jgi:hypothetical protein
VTHKNTNKEPSAITGAIFANIWMNYMFALIVGGLVFTITEVGLYWVNIKNDTVRLIASIAIAVIFTLTDRYTVGLQKRAMLTLFKQETGVWIPAGVYLLFWIFGIYEEEIQDTQRMDVKVGQKDDLFTVSDKNGKKLIVKIDADYAIGESDEASEKYKKMKEGDLSGNLKTLLERAAVRILGAREYWSEIIGKELHKALLEDGEVLEHSARYGIVFTSMMVEVRSGNQEQDDLNAQRRSLTAEYKALHPSMSDRQISEMVEVQLKLADKFISRSPVQSRYEIGESKGGERRSPKK